jgi:polysaccharide export outer membrane protein
MTSASSNTSSGSSPRSGSDRRAFLAGAGCVLARLLAGCDRPATDVVLPPPASKKSDAVREGDKLSIVVRGQEDMTGEYSVGDEGSFRFPRIGAVDAAGRKPTDIASEIETRLAEGWLRDPQVTVLVTERQNPEEVTVLGSVKEQGSYAHDGQLTLMRAISLAGGMTPEANRRKVKLTRETDAGRRTVEVDVQAIIDGRIRDIPVAPGDIIVVPESPI